MIPAIFGLSGLTLTDDEHAFFRDSDPAGYILFGRNIENRAQLRRLTDDLRSLDGRASLPILIDQEGGRVARMKSPEWPDFPSGAAFDALYERAQIGKHTSELQSLMRISYAVFCLTKKNTTH